MHSSTLERPTSSNRLPVGFAASEMLLELPAGLYTPALRNLRKAGAGMSQIVGANNAKRTFAFSLLGDTNIAAMRVRSITVSTDLWEVEVVGREANTPLTAAQPQRIL